MCNKNKLMKKLELKYEFRNIAMPYKEELAIWENSKAEFRTEKKNTEYFGHLRLWGNDVEPEEIKNEWEKLEKLLESFALAMKFIGNRKISYKKEGELIYYLGDDEYTICNDLDITNIIKRTKGEEFNYINVTLPVIRAELKGETSPISLPEQMPHIPLNLKRYVITIVQAEELDDYQEHYEDEQLKRWFLILEELENNTNGIDYKNIKHVRNFVSHPMCYDSNLINFLNNELPQSVYTNDAGRDEAKFKREEPSHIAFVSKYQNKARRWAKKLVEDEIKKFGGSI